MHMSDALLSPAVGLAFSGISAGAVALTAAKLKKEEFGEKTIPMMGVMGAFVFAGQMINFTIPATGSSGHIGGGILLAALLGGGPAFLAIAAVLIIQCLFFADGGLLALGCNIFNMGIIPCFVAWPLIFRPIIKRVMNAKNLAVASVLACVVGLQLGAFMVVMQTTVSGITALPFSSFVLLMQPIHLAIGAVEGLITAAVLIFVHKARPDALYGANQTAGSGGLKLRTFLAVFAILALVVGGGLSLFASSHPDGLEWAIERVAGSAELEAEGRVMESAQAIQQKTAFMPDYEIPGGEGSTAAGIVGGILTFGLAAAAGGIIYAIKKKSSRA